MNFLAVRKPTRFPSNVAASEDPCTDEALIRFTASPTMSSTSVQVSVEVNRSKNEQSQTSAMDLCRHEEKRR